MQVWIYTIVSVLILSAISLVGVFIFFFREEKVKKISLFVVSFAVGAMFGDVFIHILPEAFGKTGSSLMTPFGVIIGILIFFSLEKFLRWRHCHIQNSTGHYHPVVAMNLVGDNVHNLLDGVLIGASFLVSIPIGIASAVAIILHEIPQEIGDFGMLIRFGLSKRKALIFNFISSFSAIFGALASLILGSFIKDYALFMLPLTAGSLIYLAGSDLIPELHHETKVSASLAQLVAIMMGVGGMALLLTAG